MNVGSRLLEHCSNPYALRLALVPDGRACRQNLFIASGLKDTYAIIKVRSLCSGPCSSRRLAGASARTGASLPEIVCDSHGGYYGYICSVLVHLVIYGS